MSRFDRRMGKVTPGRNSPRPGTATCKLQPKKTTMLSNTSMLLNTKKNEVINNIAHTTNIMINEVSEKNERLLQKLEISRNPTERILLNHELRLNTMELNVDCLNNFECNEKEDYQSQINLQKKQINDLESKLKLFEERIMNMSSINSKNIQEEVTMDINDIVNKVDKSTSNAVEDVAEEVAEEVAEDVDDDSPTFE